MCILATGASIKPNATTTAPCYRGDIMYQDGAVVSIKDIDTNKPVSVLSLRTDTDGVTFPDSQNPTLLVEIDPALVSEIISIAIPNKDGATNVNQIELTFFDAAGEVILNPAGEPWIVTTTPGITIVRLVAFSHFREYQVFCLFHRWNS